MSFTIEPRTNLIWAAVDFDGTLAEHVWPDPGIGEPIQDNIDKLVELVQNGYKIIIHTSRGWEGYELIEAWLNHYSIPFDRIVCGKLLAKVYIDDRAIPADAESWMPMEKVPA